MIMKVESLFKIMLTNHLTYIMSVILFYPITLIYYFCINVISEMINGIKLGWKLFKTDMGFMPQFSKSHYEQKKEKFEKTGSLL